MSITPNIASRVLIALKESPNVHELPLDGKTMSREEAIEYCNQIVREEEERITNINEQKQTKLDKMSIAELIEALSEGAHQEGVNEAEQWYSYAPNHIHAKDLQRELENRLRAENLI